MCELGLGQARQVVALQSHILQLLVVARYTGNGMAENNDTVRKSPSAREHFVGGFWSGEGCLARLPGRHIAVVDLQHEDGHCGAEYVGSSMTGVSVPMPV